MDASNATIGELTEPGKVVVVKFGLSRLTSQCEDTVAVTRELWPVVIARVIEEPG